MGGISGWRYAPWRGVFYPRRLPQNRELAFASRTLSSIEINGSFYSLQRPQSWEAWRRAAPEDFVFSVKGPRYITHIRRLRDIEAPLANFFASGLFNLRDKLGPFLWQFPPNFRYDAERLERFFALLPRDTEEALALARKREARMKGRYGSPWTATAGCGMPWRYGTRAFSTSRSSHCCAATASRSSSRTRPARGRTGRT